MISAAQLALDRIEHGLSAEFESVPGWQWRLRFDELAPVCPSRLGAVAGRDFNRQRNALRIEIVPSQTRCALQSPDGRGLAWLLSGGSPLSYGPCALCVCPRGAP